MATRPHKQQEVNKPIGWPRGKRLVAGVVIVLLLAVGIYELIDYPYRQRFDEVYSQVEKVRHDVMDPTEAVEWKGGTYTPQLLGNGWVNSLGCIDVQCPSVSRTWFVPLQPGQNDAFIKKVMDAEGYQQYNGSIGTRGKLTMSVVVNSLGPIAPPYSPPAGKQWELVQVSVSE